MKTVDEARELAEAYRIQADEIGVSPRMATVLRNIANSFAALASQYEMLETIAAEESRQRAN